MCDNNNHECDPFANFAKIIDRKHFATYGISHVSDPEKVFVRGKCLYTDPRDQNVLRHFTSLLHDSSTTLSFTVI